MDIASCNGKKVYLTYDHAKHDAGELLRKYDDRTQVYRCRECQAWHVGVPRLRKERRPPAAPPAYDDE